jgi:phosphatidate cytidylyltransferase
MLKKRVITSLLAIPLLFVIVWFDQPLLWFSVLAAIWALLAVHEFYRLVGISRVLSLTGFGLIWTLLFVLSPHFDHALVIPILLTSAIILPLLWLVLRPEREGAFIGWSWTVAGILYVGWLLSYLVALRLDAGRNWVFFAFFTTFGSDTTAFFIGRALGRHHLAPYISPNKTWEGAISGVFGAILISLFFLLSTPLQLPIGYGHVIFLAFLVSVFGQFGDLVESLLKRNVGVKESGKMLPGHGGFLDRMDSVVFAGVVVYLYYAFIIS